MSFFEEIWYLFIFLLPYIIKVAFVAFIFWGVYALFFRRKK